MIVTILENLVYNTVSRTEYKIWIEENGFIKVIFYVLDACNYISRFLSYNHISKMLINTFKHLGWPSRE